MINLFRVLVNGIEDDDIGILALPQEVFFTQYDKWPPPPLCLKSDARAPFPSHSSGTRSAAPRSLRVSRPRRITREGETDGRTDLRSEIGLSRKQYAAL